MKFSTSSRGVVAFAVLLLLLFLFRPAVSQLRGRIARSIANALARRVEIDNVRVRFLPQPGFDLEGLTIYDDPAFNAEPMIRAQEVSAAIRLRSLLRGRFEIATLSATEPSINLVRNDAGKWNLSTLIERNAQIPAAPSVKSPDERRPAFPYLEAKNARVNFKIGLIKKSFALMNADLALWQDSENSWRARLKAEPVRTDFNLTDTGLVQINAAWQRAASLRQTPLQITAQWQKGQLGQITQLLTGRDRGWRGGVILNAKFSGTPEALLIDSQAEITDFHRYDILGSERERISTSCKANYDAVTTAFTEMACKSPVSDGNLQLSGRLTLANPRPAYDLIFAVDRVPVESALRLLRQAKKQIPIDLTASGLISAEFHGRNTATDDARSSSTVWSDTGIWSGAGSATDVRLFSSDAKNGKDEIVIGTIPLTLISTNPHNTARQREKDPEQAENHLRIDPTTVAVRASLPSNVTGWVSASGYHFSLRGDMPLQDIFHLEDVLGLSFVQPAAEGTAKLDVAVSGAWQGFAPPVTTGSVQLTNVRAELHGLHAPVEIISAEIMLAPEVARMQKISARIGTTDWSGQITAPRHCIAPVNCEFQFDLAADHISTADFSDWFVPQSKRPWYRILTSDQTQDSSPLLTLQAHGTLHVGRFDLKKMPVTQLSTQVQIDHGKIALTSLHAQLLQGTHSGNWMIDMVPALHYRGDGKLQNISLPKISTLMNDNWITGNTDTAFDVEAFGNTFRDLLASAHGKMQFTMREGSLLHIELPGSSTAMPVHRFAGELSVKDGVWNISGGKLESRDGLYEVTGTVSPASGLNFTLLRGDHQSFSLSGTLGKPHIVATSTEAARVEAQAKITRP